MNRRRLRVCRGAIKDVRDFIIMQQPYWRLFRGARRCIYNSSGGDVTFLPLGNTAKFDDPHELCRLKTHENPGKTIAQDRLIFARVFAQLGDGGEKIALQFKGFLVGPARALQCSPYGSTDNLHGISRVVDFVRERHDEGAEQVSWIGVLLRFWSGLTPAGRWRKEAGCHRRLAVSPPVPRHATGRLSVTLPVSSNYNRRPPRHVSCF